MKNHINLDVPKGLYAFIMIVLIGALSSGVWERFLAPFSDLLIYYAVNFLSSISNNYSASLYKRIGNAEKELFSMKVFLMALGVLSAVVLALIILIYRKFSDRTYANKDRQMPHSISSKIMSRFYMVLLFIVVLIWMTDAFADMYSYGAQIYIERSIEILAPKVSNQKLLELRAMYRTVDSKDKFLELNSELLKTAKECKIQLPEFKAIL